MISQRTFQDLVTQVNTKFAALDKVIAELKKELEAAKEPKKTKEKA